MPSEARSDLERFFLVRDHLPDSDLIAALEAKRGLGRDDYPVIPMWNAIVAGVVFQHESIELLQRELSRNPSGCVANIPKAATRTYLRAKLSC